MCVRAAELEAHDFAPFRRLNGYPIAMTAHVVYGALDPDRPATQSTIILNDVIRKKIGYDGVVITDDLTMNALSGSTGERAGACFAAGCDMVLHCNGDLAQMEAVAQEAPRIAGKCAERTDDALAKLSMPGEYDVDEALQDLDLALRESV